MENFTGRNIGEIPVHNPFTQKADFSGAFNNGFKGICAVFVTAAFSFAGTELAGLAAAETVFYHLISELIVSGQSQRIRSSSLQASLLACEPVLHHFAYRRRMHRPIHASWPRVEGL